MDVGKKDIRNTALSSQIEENKNFLNSHYNQLKIQEDSNPYLESIKNEYKCFHDNCLQEKKAQIQHMNNLVKYLNIHKSARPELNHDIKQINETKKNLMKEANKNKTSSKFK